MEPRTTAVRRHTRTDLFGAIISVSVTLLIGAIGAVATASSVHSWYAGLAKPSFNPPNAVFAPVWTFLYILMGLAAWRVWRVARAHGDAWAALRLYRCQLYLNLAWSLIFFGARRPDVALAEIGILFLAILGATAAFWRRDRVAGLIMMPYLAWVAFAALLNFEIWRLN